MRLSAAASIVVLALGLGAPGVARAADGDRQEARQHFNAGQQKYKSGDLRGAIVEFMASDALVPVAGISFNVALCYDQLGENAQAVRMYRDYLTRRPDAPNRAQVEARIASLEPAAKPQQPPPPPADQIQPIQPQRPGGPGPDDGLHEPAPPVGPAEAAPPAGEVPQARAYDWTFSRRVPDRRRGRAHAAGGVAPDQGAMPEPAPVPEPSTAGDDTPIYKEWWFWVVVGVSAVVVIDIAIGSANDGDRTVVTNRPTGLTIHF